MFIETETTPNPASLKFMPGRQVMPSGTREFPSPEAAEASPLAQAIFDTGEVTNVFFGSDFIAVTAAPGVEWSALKPQVVSILLDHFVSEAPLFAGGDAAGIAVPGEDAMLVEEDPANADVVAQINELLETRVRPAVAGDGGDIQYRGFRDGIVYLQLRQGHGLSQDAGRLFGLPQLDRDAQARHRRPAEALRARSDRGSRGLTATTGE